MHRRDNSVASQLSQESLKKIYSFALNQELESKDKTAEKSKNEAKKESNPSKTPNSSKRPKVYYVEEQVKILSEIIAQADPILGELASIIHQFQKLVDMKVSAKQRDIQMFERYGKEDFMAEREKLNISFHQMQEIEAIQLVKKFKISVRNNLGLKQHDDWIFNLNIGNVMHLSLMGTDELQKIEKGE